MKKIAIPAMFLILCFALFGHQLQERIQKTRDFLGKSHIQRFRQAEPMRFFITWEGQPNSSFPYSITATSDGGYLINAMTWAFGEGACDMWLIKIDANFEVEWQKTYGDENRDGWSNCTIRETNDGGFLVFTDTNSFGREIYDFWILKLNSTGEIEWQRTYGTQDYDTADGELQPTKDGGFIAIGSTYRGGTFLYDIWILKLDRNGQIEWNRAYGEPNSYELGYSVQQASDGGYIVGGSQLPAGSDDYRPIIIKLSAAGDVQWQKALGSNERREFFFPHVRETNDGGFLLADNSLSAGAGSSDLWMAKLSPSGDILWQKLYGGNGIELARSLWPTTDGGCLVAASTSSFGAGGSDFWLLRLDSAGGIQWQKTYGTDKTEYPFFILPTHDGDYIVSGYSLLGTRGEMVIIKISPDGEIGPCSLVQNSNAIVTAAPIAPMATNVVTSIRDVIIGDTSAIPRSTNEHPTFYCSNLVQPPTNISIIREINRSLFVKEYYNRLTWDADSWNDRFNIVEYRIYRKAASGQTYQLLAGVNSNIFSYMDGPVDSSEDYQYALTSVDSEGRESPRSLPVRAL